MHARIYLLSLPERMARSAIGLGAGMVRELGELAIPGAIRRSQLYQNVVDGPLRFLVEEVGGVEGVYEPETRPSGDFFVRKLVGDGLEGLGIAAFRVSPVWVLAALADVCGAGKHLIPEIAEALAADGLIDKNVRSTNAEQLLDALERTVARLAGSIGAPPLDVGSLRREWQALREEVRTIPPDALPSRETLRNLWMQLKAESASQQRSISEMSSVLALSASAKFPDGIRWVSSSARVAARRTSLVFAHTLLNHYQQTLGEVRRVGFARYAMTHCRPYVYAAAGHFSPARRTLTERMIAGRVGLVGRVGQGGQVGPAGSSGSDGSDGLSGSGG